MKIGPHFAKVFIKRLGVYFFGTHYRYYNKCHYVT